MDIITSCAFGIDTHSLTEKNAEFFRVLGGLIKISGIRHIKRLCLIYFPFVFRFFRVNLVHSEVIDFVTNIIRDTIEYRQKNNVKRNDFLDLLINIKYNKNNENGYADYNNEGLTIEQMTAQTFVFFLAGFEASSSLMAFCLYELSRHQDIQERLYKDIVDAMDKNEGKISYQMLMEIPFLNQVINETLRMYGAGHFLRRVCTKPYAVPDSDLVLEQGLTVSIPLYSLHHDPHYYPDPYAFKPERFSVEESKERHPFVFLPFGEGPRNCIAKRFGQMQTKVGLATVLLNFQVDPSPNQEDPIEIDKRSLTMMAANPVLLKFTKRRTT